jgi:hypothetical protein
LNLTDYDNGKMKNKKNKPKINESIKKNKKYLSLLILLRQKIKTF